MSDTTLLVGGAVITGTSITGEEFTAQTGIAAEAGYVYLRDAQVNGSGRGWFRCKAVDVIGELIRLSGTTGKPATGGVRSTSEFQI